MVVSRLELAIILTEAREACRQRMRRMHSFIDINIAERRIKYWKWGDDDEWMNHDDGSVDDRPA